MAYNAHSERTFQALQKQREESVKRLRVALEKAGVREYVSNLYPNPIDGVRKLLPQTTSKAFDIENVIKNAMEIRQALRDFDNSVAQPPSTGE
jgi:hypothetical protein